MKLATVRHRIMSSLLDFGIVLGVLVVLTIGKLPFIINMVTTHEHVVSSKFVLDVFRIGIMYTIILLIYYIVIPIFLNGQTIGKKIFKLKIIDTEEKELTFRSMFYREGIGTIFLNFASLGITIIVSTIIMILREDNKSLSDILAKTKVIDLYEREEK